MQIQTSICVSFHRGVLYKPQYIDDTLVTSNEKGVIAQTRLEALRTRLRQSRLMILAPNKS